jgi:hypothetical protein
MCAVPRRRPALGFATNSTKYFLLAISHLRLWWYHIYVQEWLGVQELEAIGGQLFDVLQAYPSKTPLLQYLITKMRTNLQHVDVRTSVTGGQLLDGGERIDSIDGRTAQRMLSVGTAMLTVAQQYNIR